MDSYDWFCGPWPYISNATSVNPTHPLLLFQYLVGFVGVGYEHTALPPAVALMTADRPEQDISQALAAFSALFDV